MAKFEENLNKLEELTRDIKRSDISLEDALKDFEEGIKLAKMMEKEIDKIEGKIQILMNQPSEMEDPENSCTLSSFSDSNNSNETDAPEYGTRK